MSSSNENGHKLEQREETIETTNAAVCIVSGGLDSICTAAYLKEMCYDLYILTFSYGQRAIREIACAREFSKILKAKDHRIINIGFMKEIYGTTNVLTNSKRDLPKKFDYSIVVPIRNAIFITIAAAWAMSINAKLVAYGAHIGDSHYPDCRPEFIKSITDMLNIAESDGIKRGLRNEINVWSPAVEKLDKHELLRAGYQILGDQIFKTWSCYSNGIKGRRGNYDSGRNNTLLQCGVCESCINRKIAISKAGIKDKTNYAKNE